ncbi:L,D-transpeptidase [Rubellimicrobium aerolatum]|uniref:L,D-transpeptidase n=1 Tax=Rubellimicrobium aerolatum TaxID=490979 RepID=A0ABW0SCV2_9RHOB|nr:L,D-transpeptidase [Rubellimicrobium aerolatum]MBP1806544.1 lipoprotein-anchoring transpeptidase ErfK/SrfK [Rubellimicrobium aerolatum]
MLTRRRFLAASGLALAAGGGAAQELLPVSVSPVEDPGPLRLDIGPEAVQASLSLPPDMEGDHAIPERFRARVVQVAPGLVPNDIHIVPQSYNLYFILPGDYAIRYGVAVGQQGLGWHGQAEIGRKVEWPSWRPTDEMIERHPERYSKYAEGMPGGPDNPLGARALYFFQGERDTQIRVHGTTDPTSIGHQASNGCFRMYNSHVIDLYNRVPLGARAFAY